MPHVPQQTDKLPEGINVWAMGLSFRDYVTYYVLLIFSAILSHDSIGIVLSYELLEFLQTYHRLVVDFL